MSHNSLNDAQSCTFTTAESEDLDVLTMIYDYAMSNASAHWAGHEMPSYVPLSFNAPSGSGIPPHPSPPYPSEDPHPSRDPRSPDPFQYWWWPILPDIPEVFLPPAIGPIDAHGIGCATSPTNSHYSPSEPIPPPSIASTPAPGSNTQIGSITGDDSWATAPDTPGPSTLVVLEEITHPPELPVVSSCDFDGTLTLGDALKKDFSQISRDSASRAFPSDHCAAKMAFWHMFDRDLGSTFRPRREQVTVTTTRKSVMQQPSKARLAYLVAREMEKYLKECRLRQKPFPYTLEDIILRRIDLVSKGTLRPRLYVRVRQPRLVQSALAATC